MTRQKMIPSASLDMMTGEHVAQGEGAALDAAVAGLSAADVTAEDWDEWAEGLRRREAVYRRARLRLEALRAGEVLPECAQCGETIVGRSDARYCSTRCRVAAHRAKGKLTETERRERSAAKAREDRGQLLDNFHNEIESLVFIARNLDPKAQEYIAERFRDATADIEAE